MSSASRPAPRRRRLAARAGALRALGVLLVAALGTGQASAQNTLRVEHAAGKDQARAGDIVPFTIRLTNLTAAPVLGVNVREQLPPGFVFAANSAVIGGAPVAPTASSGRELVWTGIDFAAGETVVVSFLAATTSGLGEGAYTARASGEDAGSTLLSNVAAATVVIEPDGLFDSSDVIGRVFEDRNGNGYADRGEPGVPGVVLYTVNGLEITTDRYGRFHIASAADALDTIGSSFILKVNENTVPGGWRITSENPRVVRVTEGKVAKIDFAVQPSSWDMNAEGDGVEVQGGESVAVDGQLDPTDLRMRLDPFRAEPFLNVTASPRVVRRGQPMRFRMFTNYGSWIERAEVRVFPPYASTRSKPLAVIPIDPAVGDAAWDVVGQPEATFGQTARKTGEAVEPGTHFVLRVYDRKGRFDETGSKELHFAEGDAEPDEFLSGEDELNSGQGENHLLLKNIPLDGARVLIDGRDVPPGGRVIFQGQPVAVDTSGRFAAEQWVPFGDHEISVRVEDAEGKGYSWKRSVYVPEEDWFFVALGDLLVGSSSADDVGRRLAGGEGFLTNGAEGPLRDEVYVNGRAAFFLKGWIKGEYLLTAALDTGDQEIEDVLKGLDDKDPQSLLRRIQPDETYAVYGDDSSTRELAPTQGRFFVKLEKGDSHAMWGNFKTSLVGTDFAQVDRALYGARVHWESDQKTEKGDDRTTVDAFASSPDTLLARDEFQGHGGSVYYLRHQDLTVGSERLRVETRDRETGLILDSKYLTPFEDYTVDYIQGRIVLLKPLPTVSDDGELVSVGSLFGNPVHLVARYEFRPVTNNPDNMAVGGRAEHWVDERWRFGTTWSQEEQEDEDQKLWGLDVIYRSSDRTYAKAEVVRTEGPGFGEDASQDGGFTFSGIPKALRSAERGTGYRFEGALDFGEVLDGATYRGTGYVQRREKGFAAPGQLTATDTLQWGAGFDDELWNDTEYHARWDELQIEDGLTNKTATLDVTTDLEGGWRATFGGRYSSVEDDGAALGVREGERTDAALKLAYRIEEDFTIYGFGQDTLRKNEERRNNDRWGMGGSARLNDRLNVGAEVSDGTGGVGANLRGDYALSDRTDVYLSYLTDSDRTDTGLGAHNGGFTAGARSRFTDELSIFTEERLLEGEGVSGVSHSFGLDYVPSDRWNVGALFEMGDLEQLTGPNLNRNSASVHGSVRWEDLTYGGALEFRDEKVVGVEREVWAMRNRGSLQVNNDMRVIGEANFLVSDDDGGTFFDGEYVELLAGLAYRPTDNDRWNTLFTYRFLDDTPTAGQLPSSLTGENYRQKSHVVAGDVTFRAWRWLDLGGKLARRWSDLRTSGSDWFEDEGNLAILRADLHVVHEWDVHAESRWTSTDLAEADSMGMLVAVYRHVNEHTKVGVGYNFTEFNDDLTDLDYDADGFFFNVIVKY